MKIKNAIRILKMLPGDYEEEIEKLEVWQTTAYDSVIRIANAGPMNPGKSTLFNAFLRKEEVFKTADRRQTSVCQEEPWKDGFALLDTPGCNSVVFEDNKESVSAFRRADFIVFVHDIMTGGLINDEINVLKNLLLVFGKKEFLNRVFMVCVRIDDAEDDAIERNRNEIVTQLKENLDVNLRMFCVSSKYYLRGIQSEENGDKEEAEVWYETSNMQELLDFINAAAGKYGKRVPIDLNALAEKLSETRKTLETELEKEKKALSQEQDEIRAAWQDALDNIRPAWEKCRPEIKLDSPDLKFPFPLW